MSVQAGKPDKSSSIAFSEVDAEVMSFIKFIGALVFCDLIDGDFIHQVRELKPDLFEMAPRH